MFPFQKGNLCFNNFSNKNNKQDAIYYIVNDANDVPNYNFESQNVIRKNPTNSLNFLDKDTNNTPCNSNDNVNHHQGKMISGNDGANKRVIHRETERQRRQEMANIYSSLRSILPLDYVKGKRSMSDHICEATKYIKDLKKNINELENKRNNLKNTRSSSTTINNSSSSRDDYNVSIYTFSKAIEIQICSRLVKQEEEDNSLALSRVLKVLNEQGFDVGSCVSSKLNNKWVYIIHCQVQHPLIHVNYNGD